MEELNIIVDQLDELIENRSFSSIKEILKNMEPMDISIVLQEFPKKIAILFIRAQDIKFCLRLQMKNKVKLVKFYRAMASLVL